MDVAPQAELQHKITQSSLGVLPQIYREDEHNLRLPPLITIATLSYTMLVVTVILYERRWRAYLAHLCHAEDLERVAAHLGLEEEAHVGHGGGRWRPGSRRAGRGRDE